MTPFKLYFSTSIINQIQSHFSNLTPLDKNLRFGSNLSDSIINEYINTSFNNNDIWFGIQDNNQLVGLLHIALLPNNQAEFGCSVLKSYQKQGLGTELITRGLIWSKANGIKKVHVQCLASNHAMRKMAKNLGIETETHFSETYGVYEIPESTFTDILLDNIYSYIEICEYLLLTQFHFWRNKICQ